MVNNVELFEQIVTLDDFNNHAYQYALFLHVGFHWFNDVA